MAQHVARLVRVLARPQQHGLPLAGLRGRGAVRLLLWLPAFVRPAFHLPCGSESCSPVSKGGQLAGIARGQPVALLVPKGGSYYSSPLLASGDPGSFPDLYTEADLENIEGHLPGTALVSSRTSRRKFCGRGHKTPKPGVDLLWLHPG